MENKFIILMPVYNAKKYIGAAIHSVLTQDYKNFLLVIIDDASTDGTLEFAKTFEDRNNVRIIANKERVGSALANMVTAIQMFATNREDIIVGVDGDDKLSCDDVLSHLNEVYSNADIWMTYGQFIPASGAYGPYCRKIDDIRGYRESPYWWASHLRTFKKKLWDKVKDSDLRDETGGYYKTAWDAAFIYPMLEMCGQKHHMFIEKVCYVYTDNSDLNDFKINGRSQVDNSEAIKRKPKYKELKNI